MEYEHLGCVERFIVDNSKAFEDGIDSETLQEFHEKGSFPGYTLLGVQKKLHDYCHVERKHINEKKTRVYKLKAHIQLLAHTSKDDEPKDEPKKEESKEEQKDEPEYVEFLDDADFEILNKFPFTIRRKSTHRKLKTYMKNGFQAININGHKYYLQYIIATQFIDNPKDYRFVRHINGIKDDNRLENLEWNRFKE